MQKMAIIKAWQAQNKKESKTINNFNLPITSQINDFQIEFIPSEWIDAKIAVPHTFAEIIICDAAGVEYIGTFDRLGRYLNHTGSQVENVVAWMPAPAPYEVRA